MPYFQPLVGTYKDGLPLDKIVDPNIRSIAQIISYFLELSRGVRNKQIHGRFFYPIFKWLAQGEPVNWATMVQEELLKGLKFAQTLISFGPQLTRVIEFALGNPGIYTRVANNHERDLRDPPRYRVPRHSRNQRPNPNPQHIPNPIILNAIPIRNPGDLGGDFDLGGDRDENDLYA